MKKVDIIEAIYRERERQNKQWGGKEHDQTHSITVWTSIIGNQLHKLLIGGVDPKKKLIYIAAVCFAALENEESWTK